MDVDPRLALERLLASPSAAYGRIELSKQSEAEQALQFAWEALKEVGDGAFVEYFAGPSGQHARRAVSALREIGAEEAANCMDRALSLVDNSASDLQTGEGRGGLPIKVLAALTDCDEQFRMLDRQVHRQLYEYVVAKRDSIRGAQQIEQLGNLKLLHERRLTRFSLFGLMGAMAVLAACFAFSCASIVVILFLGPVLTLVSRRPVFWMAFTIAAWVCLFVVVRVAPPPIDFMPVPGTEPGHRERVEEHRKLLAEQARWALPLYAVGLLSASVVAGWAAQGLVDNFTPAGASSADKSDNLQPRQ